MRTALVVPLYVVLGLYWMLRVVAILPVGLVWAGATWAGDDELADRLDRLLDRLIAPPRG
jgi:hypothetical protein